MIPTVFIDGDQGTTGLQILARLKDRRDLRLAVLPPDQRKDARRRAQAINDCDIAILCLPDEAARQAVASVHHPAVRIIDASSAHRTHPDWTYGFAELDTEQPARIARATRVSNPGCYPSGAVALLRPLIDAGLLARDHPITVQAVSGYSGRGREGIEAHEGAQAGTALPFQVYGLSLAHKHTPEIQHHAGLSEAPLFVPAYGAFRQGIVLTIGLHRRLLPPGTDGTRIQACLAEHYADSAELDVLSLRESAALPYLDPQQLNGSNRLRLAVFENASAGQILLAAVFDNLGKGASGAAVQNLDLMLAWRTGQAINPMPAAARANASA